MPPLAIPLTWPPDSTGGRVSGRVRAAVPLPVVRSFYALDLPGSELGITLLIAGLGAASIMGFWLVRPTR